MVRAGKEFKAWKFFLLTHSRQIKGFPWQALFTHPDSQLSFREELSSHRAEGSSSLSCGAHSEVSASQHCRTLLHTAAPCSAPLLGAKGSPAPHFWRLLVRAGWSASDLTSIIPVSWSCCGKLQKQQRKTPEAATAHSLELFTGAWDGRNTAHQNYICMVFVLSQYIAVKEFIPLHWLWRDPQGTGQCIPDVNTCIACMSPTWMFKAKRTVQKQKNLSLPNGLRKWQQTLHATNRGIWEAEGKKIVSRAPVFVLARG